MAKDRDALRRSILEQAGKILLEEGIDALSMRKLSKRVDASTMVLYTCFENKQEILDQLYLDGFARLEQRLETVPPGDDPNQYLIDLGWAYREAALANVPGYLLMQSRAQPGFTVPETSLAKARESFAVLQQAVTRCMEAGTMAPDDAGHIAQILWANIHGLISLQLFGHFQSEQDARERFARALEMMKEGLRVRKQGEDET